MSCVIVVVVFLVVVMFLVQKSEIVVAPPSDNNWSSMTRQGQRNITQQLLCHSPRHAKGNCSLQLLQLQYNYDNGGDAVDDGGGGIVSSVRLVRVITYCWNDDPLASDGTRLFVGCCGNLMSRKQYHRPTERPTDFEKNVLLQKVSFNYEGPSQQ